MTGDFYFITFHANSIIDILHLSYSHLLKGTTPDRSPLCGSHQEHSWEDHAHLSLNSHQASVSHLLEKDLTYHGRKSEIYGLHHSFLFVLFLSVKFWLPLTIFHVFLYSLKLALMLGF